MVNIPDRNGYQQIQHRLPFSFEIFKIFVVMTQGLQSKARHRLKVLFTLSSNIQYFLLFTTNISQNHQNSKLAYSKQIWELSSHKSTEKFQKSKEKEMKIEKRTTEVIYIKLIALRFYDFIEEARNMIW